MKRFTETLKWEDPWFRRLKPHQKLLWQYMCDRCDHSGVIDLDYEAASFQIGAEVSEADLLAFGERVEKLPCGKAWVTKFVKFQYGELSMECKAHRPVFAAIAKNGLNERVSKPIDTLSKAIRGSPVDYHSSLQEADKEKDKESVGGGVGGGASGLPDWPAVKANALQIGLAEWKARDFFDEMEGCGWLDYNRRPIRKWQNVLNRVKVKWEADGRPSQPPINPNHATNGTNTNRGNSAVAPANNNANRSAVSDYSGLRPKV